VALAPGARTAPIAARGGVPPRCTGSISVHRLAAPDELRKRSAQPGSQRKRASQPEDRIFVPPQRRAGAGGRIAASGAIETDQVEHVRLLQRVRPSPMMRADAVRRELQRRQILLRLIVSDA
jgi:hypothetical protein